MGDDPAAKVDELGVAEVVFCIVGAPCADDEIPSAVGPGNMVDSGEHCKARLIDRAARPRFIVVIPADERPIELFAGVEVLGAVIGDCGVDRQSIVFAGYRMSGTLAVASDMRSRLAAEPAEVGFLLDAEHERDGVARRQLSAFGCWRASLAQGVRQLAIEVGMIAFAVGIVADGRSGQSRPGELDMLRLGVKPYAQGKGYRF